MPKARTLCNDQSQIMDPLFCHKPDLSLYMKKPTDKTENVVLGPVQGAFSNRSHTTNETACSRAFILKRQRPIGLL